MLSGALYSDQVLQLPLTSSFPCRASGSGRSKRHPVVIGRDWSVDTGHDEALERIAQALGGAVTCLPTLRGVMPGFQLWWQRARRTVLLIASVDQGATWISVDGVLPCCPRRGFSDPGSAAAHSRGVRHVASVAGVPSRLLGALVTGLGADADPGPPQAAGGEPWVRRQSGRGRRSPAAAEAWACGLRPEWVAEISGVISVAQEPTVDVLLALAQTGADPGWVVDTAQRARTPGSGRWLAWTVTRLDVRDAGARADWMATGARRADIETLSAADYLPATVQAIAGDWRISVPGAAQQLARWVVAGYRPDASQLAWVRAEGHGFLPWPPALSAVERVATGLGPQRRLDDLAADLDRTAIAVALARWGTVPDTLAALRRGSDAPPQTSPARSSTVSMAGAGNG